MEKLTKLHNTLENIKTQIKDAVDEVYNDYKKEKTFENSTLLTVLENSHDYTADRLLSILDYFASNEFSYDGVLGEDERGKYVIEGTNYYFSCGSSIEIFAIEDEYDGAKWHAGRIEHNKDLGGYYFHNHYGDDIKLKPGMRARVRNVLTRW